MKCYIASINRRTIQFALATNSFPKAAQGTLCRQPIGVADTTKLLPQARGSQVQNLK